MRIVLLAPPGGGKGTQGGLIENEWGIPRISTGDRLRKAVRERTSLGLRAEAMMDAGGLVDDELVIGLVHERIAQPDCAAGYILDGFPRTVSQAESLEAVDPGRREIALDIAVDEETMIRRLGQRLVCSECGAVPNPGTLTRNQENACAACGGNLIRRSDDSPEVVAERLEVYKKTIEPVLRYYEKRNTLVRIDGSGNVGDVYARIRAVLPPPPGGDMIFRSEQ